MRVVIGGGGLVGGELARKLVEEKNDVIIIDEDREICDSLYAELGVVAIHGSSARLEVLNEAEARKADLLVAATGSDSANLACAVLAKSLGVPKIIARVRNADYESAYRMAGVDSMVRVTDLMVNQIMMEIQHPVARNISTIGCGRANIFAVMVPEGTKVAGKTVKEIAALPSFPTQCVFAASYNTRNDTFTIPRGDTVIREGDELFFVTTADDIKKVTDCLIAI